MPVGARTSGRPTGPAGPGPRTLGGANSAAPAAGQQFIPSGRDSAPISAPNDGSGVATARLGPVPADEVWLIERIAVSTNSSTPTTAAVYLGSPDPANLVDQTNNGDSDVADQTNPILVPSGQTVYMRWIGMSSGAVASARIQYQVGRYQTVLMGG